MNSRLFFAGLLAGAALCAGSASASTVTITLQESGFADQVITGTAGAGFASTTSPDPFGTFQINTIQGTANPVVSNLLNSTSFNVSSAGSVPATLTVLVTATDLSVATKNFFSSLTQNGLDTGVTVTEKTYFDASNSGLLASLIGSATYTSGPVTSVINTPVSATGPYSITEEYIVSVTGGGQSANSTIQVAVPEASTWAMLLLGFAGVGLLAYRRKSSAHPFRIA